MWLLLWAVLDRAGQAGRGADDRRADQSAVERIAAGDHDALAELYDRHARPIYSLALRILRNQADAEDIVQEVVSQAWRQASHYDATRGNVAAWLLTLARSRAINRLRARRARPDRLAGELALTDVADQTPAVDVQLLSAERCRCCSASPSSWHTTKG